MKQTIGEILHFIGRSILAVANKMRLTDSNKRWFLDFGNETLRLDYDDLNEDSLVFDVGGYQGQWASDIYSKYRSTIYIFEPVQDYARLIENRFKKNDQIHIYNFGLADKSQNRKISLSGDASSLFKQTATMNNIELVDIAEFLSGQSIKHIDLIKINIEGGEYDLLDCLIESGFIGNIDNIQVQFHDFVPDAESRMTRIQSALSKTHDLTYQYRFIFENWRRKT